MRDFCNYTELAGFSGKKINSGNFIACSTHLERVLNLPVFHSKGIDSGLRETLLKFSQPKRTYSRNACIVKVETLPGLEA